MSSTRAHARTHTRRTHKHARKHANTHTRTHKHARKHAHTHTHTHFPPSTPGENLARDLERIYFVGTRVLNAAREIIEEQIKLRHSARERGETFVDFDEIGMDLAQLEEAHRLLTLDEWKFTYLHSNAADCFVNHVRTMQRMLYMPPQRMMA